MCGYLEVWYRQRQYLFEQMLDESEYIINDLPAEEDPGIKENMGQQIELIKKLIRLTSNINEKGRNEK